MHADVLFVTLAACSVWSAQQHLVRYDGPLQPQEPMTLRIKDGRSPVASRASQAPLDASQSCDCAETMSRRRAMSLWINQQFCPDPGLADQGPDDL